MGGHAHQAPADNNKNQPDNGVTSTEDDNNGFGPKYLNNNANVPPFAPAVHIDIPNNVSSSNDKIRIPQEKFKTFVGKRSLS